MSGFTHEMLSREYHLLGEGLWRQLQQTDPDDATEVILRIDGEITVATAASIYGHALSPEDFDDEKLIERLAKRWSTRKDDCASAAEDQ